MQSIGTRLATGLLALVLIATATSGCTRRDGQGGAAASASSHVVHPGDRGEHVARLQRDLRLLGIDVVIDGVYSASTQSFVEELQRFFELTVDGVVGPATHGLIDTLVAQNVDTTTVPVDTATGAVTEIEAIGHPTDAGYCFELLSHDTGASACVPEGEPLALRFVRLDPEQPPYLLVVSGPGVTRVVAQYEDGSIADLALTPLSGVAPHQALVSGGFGDRSYTFRAIGADGADMSVIVSRSSPADDLALGDVGPAVLALQDDLRSLGAALSSDGVYSFDVERIVAGIQQFFELEANGRVDAPTRALLQQLVDEAPAAV